MFFASVFVVLTMHKRGNWIRTPILVLFFRFRTWTTSSPSRWTVCWRGTWKAWKGYGTKSCSLGKWWDCCHAADKATAMSLSWLEWCWRPQFPLLTIFVSVAWSCPLWPSCWCSKWWQKKGGKERIRPLATVNVPWAPSYKVGRQMCKEKSIFWLLFLVFGHNAEVVLSCIFPVQANVPGTEFLWFWGSHTEWSKGSKKKPQKKKKKDDLWGRGVPQDTGFFWLDLHMAIPKH